MLNQLGTSPYDLQLNTASAPFNNPKAREAIYAATDFAPILKNIFHDNYPVAEGFTSPGGICYQQNVPGYQGYDPTLAKIQTAGAYDPAGGVGVGFRVLSTSPFSGVHDPKLDTLLNNAAASSSLSARCPLYDQAAEYIAKNYYGPFYFYFYFSFAPANVSVKGVGGPGLTSPLPAVAVTPAILWEDVYYNPAGA